MDNLEIRLIENNLTAKEVPLLSLLGIEQRYFSQLTIGPLAQSGQQQETHNFKVVGSNPTGSTLEIRFETEF